MPLINYEINVISTWSANWVIIVSTTVVNEGATLAITDKKIYITVVSLSTQDNTKL